MTTNLEYYRKQAKALLKAAKSGDAAALQRIQTYSSELALNTAQLTLAREQGFASWTKFKQFILESRSDQTDLIAAFVSAATSDLRQAEAMLASHPELAQGGFYAALELGDHEQVKAALADRRELAASKSGPENVEPLIYVCFSRLASAHSERAAGFAQTARVLLEHGADPNTAYNDPKWQAILCRAFTRPRDSTIIPRSGVRFWKQGRIRTTANRCTTRPNIRTMRVCTCCLSLARSQTTSTS